MGVSGVEGVINNARAEGRRLDAEEKNINFFFFFSFLSVHVVCFVCARRFAGGVSRLCSTASAVCLPPQQRCPIGS